jgi:acyl-coenzyme A thioesterase PaaI-like protein
MTETYHFLDIQVAEPPQATEDSAVRRELAGELRRMNEQLIRLDAPVDELRAARDQLARLNERLENWEKRSYSDILKRLFQGEGSRQDVLDLLDFEILTGRATAIAPPLELWLDGDLVRGRARFGLEYQGPPGRVHGGVISLALDMVMAKCQDFFQGVGFTGTLNIRYLAATPLQSEIEFQARVARVEGRKLFVEAKVFAGDEQTVEAQGIWICAQGNYQPKAGFEHFLADDEGAA